MWSAGSKTLPQVLEAPNLIYVVVKTSRLFGKLCDDNKKSK